VCCAIVSLVNIACGIIAVIVNKNKRLNSFWAFVLGVTLNVIGIIIVAVLPDKAQQPPAPASDPAKSRLIKCPLCDTQLWVKPTTTQFRCSNCDGVSALPAAHPMVKKSAA
jgi:hypothetical protein